MNVTEVFQPTPFQRRVLEDTSPTLLLAGSAGGGKSWGAGLKCHLFASHYPNSNIIISRKILDAAVASIVPTFREVYLGGREDLARFHSRTNTFRYNNGSTIFIIGIKGVAEREKIKSIGVGGSIDIIWMEEATEYEEADYDALSFRCRATAGGFTQIILSTNPGPSLHWINRRLIIGGEAKVLLSTRADNPHLSDQYKSRIERARGVEGARMREGLWTDGVGQVVDTWRNHFGEERDGDKGNVREDADYIKGGGPIGLWADDGYAGEWDAKARMYVPNSHPRFMQLVQYRKDGRLALFYEDHAVRMRTQDQMQRLFDACERNGWPKPTLGVYDKAAPSLGDEMRKAGIINVFRSPANRDDSLTVLRNEVGPDENGWRRLIVHPRCELTALQFAAYAYDEQGVPIKDNDDAVDAARYGVYTYVVEGARPTDISIFGNEAQIAEMEKLFGKIDAEWEKQWQRIQSQM